MAKRSVVASLSGIEIAKQALQRRYPSQKAFQDNIGMAWSTVNNFFNRKPIYRTNFEEICQFLGINWLDIIELPDSEKTEQLTPLDKLWQQLKTQGSHTEKMGLVIAKEDTLAWGWGNQKRYEKSVKLGNYVQLDINLETPGFLLLIQKDSSGQAWCFCPSCFAPQPQLETGKTSLPQEGANITAFPIEGTPGKEEIIAVIAPDIFSLDWLPQGNDVPLELEISHIAELIEYVNKQDNCQVWYTDYRITE